MVQLSDSTSFHIIGNSAPYITKNTQCWSSCKSQ